MKVQGFEIRADARALAERWSWESPERFTKWNIVAWLRDLSSTSNSPFGPLPRSAGDREHVYSRTAERILTKGKEMGLWSFSGSCWQPVGRRAQ